MMIIHHLEKTGEGEVIGHHFIDLCGEGCGCFIHRFPFRQNNGDLDNGRSIDIQVDPSFCYGEEDETQKNKKENVYRCHSVIPGKNGFQSQAYFRSIHWE